MTKYFDTLSFDEEILKPRVKTFFYGTLPNIMTLYSFTVRRTYAIGSRSSIINSLDTFNETYYEFFPDASNLGIPHGDVAPYLGFIISADP
jgi:hypothetical protein